MTEFNGNNNLKSKELFESRKKYGQYAYSREGEINEQPFNTALLINNGIQIHYGKIDQNGNAVYPKRKFVKSIKGQNDSAVYALDFVMEAFLNMKKEFDLALVAGKISKQEKYLSSLLPAAGMEFYEEQYLTYLKNNVLVYLNSFLDISKRKNIVSFEEHKRHINDYIKLHSSLNHFLFSSFILNRNIDRSISGLIIDIQNKEFSKDQQKVDDFIKSKNFDFYVNLAASFGFLVDKDAPWRLIADLASPKMRKYVCVCGKQYVNKYIDFSNVQDIFDLYYEVAYKKDLLYLELFYKYSHNQLVSLEDSASKFDEQCGQTKYYPRSTVSRVNLLLDDVIHNIVEYKCIETNASFTQNEIFELARNAISLKKDISEEKALSFVYSSFNKFLTTT